MRNLLKTLPSAFLFIAVFTFSNLFYAQSSSCSDFYSFDKGTKYEITHYSNKHKVESINTSEVIESATKNDKYVATIHTVITNSKGKEDLDVKYDMTCDENAIAIDYNAILGNKLAQEVGDIDLEVDITGTDIIIPNNLEVGDTLPDAEMNMSIKNTASNMGFKVTITNRKVVGEEKITTPAGTFDCIVIEEEVSMKMVVSVQTKSKQWLAKGVGLVKQETYSKNGKLQGSDELTAFTK